MHMSREKNAAAPEQGLVRFGLGLANWSERWFPDPLVFALLGIVVEQMAQDQLYMRLLASEVIAKDVIPSVTRQVIEATCRDRGCTAPDLLHAINESEWSRVAASILARARHVS